MLKKAQYIVLLMMLHKSTLFFHFTFLTRLIHPFGVKNRRNLRHYGWSKLASMRRSQIIHYSAYMTEQRHMSAVSQRHVKNLLFMTQLAANFAAKGQLNLMTSSPVATGLAHKYSSFDFINFSLGERCSVIYNIYPSDEFYMS